MKLLRRLANKLSKNAQHQYKSHQDKNVRFEAAYASDAYVHFDRTPLLATATKCLTSESYWKLMAMKQGPHCVLSVGLDYLKMFQKFVRRSVSIIRVRHVMEKPTLWTNHNQERLSPNKEVPNSQNSTGQERHGVVRSQTYCPSCYKKYMVTLLYTLVWLQWQELNGRISKTFANVFLLILAGTGRNYNQPQTKEIRTTEPSLRWHVQPKWITNVTPQE